MAAGAFTAYSNAVLSLTQGALALSSGTYVMVLLSNAYTPAPNSDTHWSDISANEIATGSGYTQGGVVLSSVTDTLAAGTITFNATPPSWPTFSATFRYAAIVRRAGSSLAGTDPLVCYCDCTGAGSVTGGGGTLTITPNASGILTITHTP
jgi:hypothetical protein